MNINSKKNIFGIIMIILSFIFITITSVLLISTLNEVYGQAGGLTFIILVIPFGIISLILFIVGSLLFFNNNKIIKIIILALVYIAYIMLFNIIYSPIYNNNYINSINLNDKLKSKAIYEIDEDEELLNCSNNENNSIICSIKSAQNIVYNLYGNVSYKYTKLINKEYITGYELNYESDYYSKLFETIDEEIKEYFKEYDYGFSNDKQKELNIKVNVNKLEDLNNSIYSFYDYLWSKKYKGYQRIIINLNYLDKTYSKTISEIVGINKKLNLNKMKYRFVSGNGEYLENKPIINNLYINGVKYSGPDNIFIYEPESNDYLVNYLNKDIMFKSPEKLLITNILKDYLNVEYNITKKNKELRINYLIGNNNYVLENYYIKDEITKKNSITNITFFNNGKGIITNKKYYKIDYYDESMDNIYITIKDLAKILNCSYEIKDNSIFLTSN